MNVLLTGANGFVGSRILRQLISREIRTRILVRPHSHRHLIEPWLERVEVCEGTLDSSEGLDRALKGVTHVVHCAGRTKALRLGEFRTANVDGVRFLAQAIARSGQVRRLVHLSSLAASHPGTPDSPARESDPPAPVSEYGRSKLEGEGVLLELHPCESIILRPSGVYGPGDTDFLQLFVAVQKGICPEFGGGRQALSLVYVDDLAGVIVDVATGTAGGGGIFNVAHARVITAGELAEEIARQMHRRVLRLALPSVLLPVICEAGEVWSRLTGRPGILSRERCRELSAPGWVCETSRLTTELGLSCRTDLADGIRQTLDWYRQQGWLRA